MRLVLPTAPSPTKTHLIRPLWLPLLRPLLPVPLLLLDDDGMSPYGLCNCSRNRGGISSDARRVLRRTPTDTHVRTLFSAWWTVTREFLACDNETLATACDSWLSLVSLSERSAITSVHSYSAVTHRAQAFEQKASGAHTRD